MNTEFNAQQLFDEIHQKNSPSPRSPNPRSPNSRSPSQGSQTSALYHLQAEAIKAFETQGWPDKSLESWKYTPAHLYLKANFQTPNAASWATLPPPAATTNIPQITLVDGKLCMPEASTLGTQLTENLTIATVNAQNLNIAESVLAQLKESPSQLSFGLASDIIHIKVKANTQNTLIVEHLFSQEAVKQQRATTDSIQTACINTPIIITQEAGSELTLFEVFQPQKPSVNSQNCKDLQDSEESQNSGQNEPPNNISNPTNNISNPTNNLSNQVTFLDQAAHSQCQHLRVLAHADADLHIGHVQAKLATKAQYHGLHFSLQGQLLRETLQVDLTGQGASVNLNALTLGQGNQHADLQIRIGHLAPNTTSDVLFKSIGEDSAKIHCNGKLYIDANGHNADGMFYSKNLMLSPKCQIFTKPEFEIYHDQVKCAHGATTAHTNPEQLRYLTARGIPLKTAKELLMQGFITDIINRSWLRSFFENAAIPDKAITNKDQTAHLQCILSKVFDRSPLLTSAFNQHDPKAQDSIAHQNKKSAQ